MFDAFLISQETGMQDTPGCFVIFRLISPWL